GTIMSVSEISKVGGQWMVISGAVTSSATDTGNTTLEILANVGLNVDDAEIDIGSGYVNGTSSTAVVGTSGVPPLNWLNSTGGLVASVIDTHQLNNTGSSPVNITVSMNTLADAEEWLCGASGATCPGDNAMVEVKMEELDGDSCIGTEQTSWLELANYTTKSTVLLCSNMKPTDGTDVFDVDFQLTIPQEAPTGSKTATFTYTAEAI
ncbi:hypothetical protein HN652_03730, partial [archaeon]|nr:hypothetical protein [archaeon]MBT6868669.1 hypothetical protein [archaeon]MBT7193364.1 hypothetical protein [archaeon]MBT7381466.1 hypothetical protein [archaeon]MBT7508099.1 hypothetical protein [archaeon]